MVARVRSFLSSLSILLVVVGCSADTTGLDAALEDSGSNRDAGPIDAASDICTCYSETELRDELEGLVAQYGSEYCGGGLYIRSRCMEQGILQPLEFRLGCWTITDTTFLGPPEGSAHYVTCPGPSPVQGSCECL
jgi:hypothetical protein